MRKIRRIYQSTQEINFNSPQKEFSLYWKRFEESELGKIYHAIPWDKLVKGFKIREYRKGPNRIFDSRGMLALMFLKSYCQCSDKKLIEYLNGNIDFQLFCGIFMGTERIDNYKIISHIRCELAKKLDIDHSQKVLAEHWLPYMDELEKATTDATCYESSVRYPTNQKLLWEAVDWSYNQMKIICKYLKTKRPRTKYDKWKSRYHSYSRKRKKPSNEKRVLTRGLLNLLTKLNEELDILEQTNHLDMPIKYFQRRATIRNVYKQQYQLFTTGENPKDRIVSLAKNYIRPIVRGKEAKPVEFGAKVNKIQINGISFIEHLSFNAFNEGTHFISSIHLAQELTHTKLKVLGADAIYATNKNRKHATKNNIRTDFARKGRAGKHEASRKQLASMITKERASRLEGSFGKEKEYYHLKKIKARTEKTEVLWIFFGIHTANALEIGRRKYNVQNIKEIA